MYAVERQQRIERILVEEGRVAVVDLAHRFDVTTETVRRDLAVLEEAGSLVRVHGGAVAKDADSTSEPTVVERASRHGAAKNAIAERALTALGPGFHGSVFIDAGTTTAAVAAGLAERLSAVQQGSRPIEAVTHSLTIAPALAATDDVSLTVVGGRIRGITAAAVGVETVSAIRRLRPDVAFIGTNGVSADFGLSTPDPDEASVKTAIVQSARRVIVVADASKHDRELLMTFASLEDIDVLVTDAEPPAALGAALADAGVEVWIA
ncbi:DeoR family fructose operon transcriptional repressor [Microbacterium natoriense]|uniref:Lactose phosphotransferase system repressor n=1 Tax=Microbacterium natoriense TaxID=284570 RepID=A0AAW8EX54_9MICO|nr:DeoR/GlpR family DNA-binding transcription regulator [Microbacterium natoriense]MDQ0647374.1 DeoR family fructose operon transcriptional repressor [Microbacterium natoriense]